MLSLHDFQKKFIEGLLEQSTDILSLIHSTKKLSSSERISIYRNSMIGALQKHLQEVYPVCCKLVGAEFFILMSNEYIQHHASTSPDLNDYGNYFADFIKNFPNTESLPYLQDVARLEWAWHTIFNANNSPALNFDQLKKCIESEEDQVVFSLSLGSYLIQSPYPLLQIWEMNQTNLDESITLEEGKLFHFFIWRDELITRIDEIDKTDWQMLTWIQEGLTIAELLKRLENHLSASDIIAKLAKLVQRKYLIDFKIKNKEIT